MAYVCEARHPARDIALTVQTQTGLQETSQPCDELRR